jgi:hypothetical protein
MRGLLGCRSRYIVGREQSSLQARGQIHPTADDGVVHPVLAAKIADGAEG